jgi:hypothetical protein
MRGEREIRDHYGITAEAYLRAAEGHSFAESLRLKR